MPQPWPLLTVDAGFATATPGLGGTELLLDDPARGVLDTATLGTVTDWTPLGGYIGDVPVIQSVTITRPSTRQQGPLVTYDAGTCTVTLANSDGRFSPENLAGPYVTGGVSQIRPMVPLRVRATWAAVTYDLFSGYVRSWTPPTALNGPDYDYTVAAAQDPFCILEGVTLPAAGAVGAGELSGARVRRILTAAGWYDAAQGGSVLDAGQSAVQAATFGDTALNLLRTAAQSEIGDLYCDGAGRVVFRDRDAPMTATRSSTVQGVFGDMPGTAQTAGPELPYEDLTRPDDDTMLANDIQATIAGSNNMQQAKDAASIAKYLFPRSYPATGLILQNDSDALNWATYVLSISRGDESRFDQLTLSGDTDPANLYPHLLGRDIGDRIQVWRRPPGTAPITKDCFIRSVTHTITVDRWETVWGLQNAARYSFLVLDHPVLGQLDDNAVNF